MQANLETLSVLERRLSVALPAADINSEVENRLKHLSRTMKMHGFRPGKVPLKVVAQHYGPQVRQEVVGDAVQRSFGEAVRQQNLKVAGYPKIEMGPVVEDAGELHYSATFEVYPEVVVGDISTATVERPLLEVGPAEVDKTIEIMRKQRVRFELAERAAESGDRVTVDFRGTLDGAEFQGSSGRDQQVVLGSERLLPDFETGVTGLKAGESKSFDVHFPDDYHGREVAGKTARFDLTVKQVAAPRLPDVDAEFAKVLGVADGDLAKMRAEIQANLEREVKAKLKVRLRDQVMQALLDATRVEAPKSLVQLEMERLRASARQELASRGVQVTDNTPLPADVFQGQALRRVNLGLILGEVVKAHNLHPRPEQVRALVEEQAQSYERPEEVVKWFYAAPERLQDSESAALEDNVVAWALGVAKVTDRVIEFDELMGKQ
ncbi:MAG: trigger factor [Betaproteobacteria bacterium RIFCSPLOWO2_02_FULL_67_26]|nr:MAG: trigger factor [Betaproteobacteria bacterium RIFCSPLOWO2_02_FULL_67_26]